MKRIIFFAILGVFLAFSNSCKKDEAETPAAASFSVKINGVLWTASNTLAGHGTLNNTTQISGIGTNVSEQISLIFKGNAVGTYKLDDFNSCSVFISGADFSSFLSENPVGQIVITKYDVANMKISGTFSFDGEDIDGTVYHATEGKFENLVLVVQ